MAHIVCITGGLTGIFNASLALVKQLEAAGHCLTYASPTDFRETLAVYNIPFVQLDRWIFQSGDPPLTRWQKLLALQERQKRAVVALGVQNFVQTMQALEPDLLLIDIEMHPHIMAAVTAGLPVALLCQFLSLWKRPNLPSIHSDIVPGQGWQGQWWGIEWSWLRYGWRKWQECQRERWRRMGLDRLSVLRCYARQIGYPLKERYGFSQWLVPYPHDSLPIICFNALELDFPHDSHPTMHYVGPMVYENRRELKVEPSMEKALERLFTVSRLEGRSLIYCGCSTFIKGNKEFLQQLVAAVSNRPQWDLILGLGRQFNLDQLGTLPANIHAFNWVSQLQVLKHADCAINNGGINSINECIHFGVPMLVYSLNRFDQNGNAARIDYHHLGIIGDIVKDKASQIRDRIQTLLKETSYKICVNKMKTLCRQYSQKNQAVRVIEELL